MIHLITGGSASGKSEYAENQVITCDGSRRIYIATMIPWDDESKKRIVRHQQMRAKKQFETIECFTGLDQLKLSQHRDENTVVLLECMSNLVANELYMKKERGLDVSRRILDGIIHLQKQAGSIIIVTNEVFSDGVTYEEDTNHYLSVLGKINQELGVMADRVTEVVCGIPVMVKQAKEKG